MTTIALARLTAEELKGYAEAMAEAVALIAELVARHPGDEPPASALRAALRGLGDRLADRAELADALVANAAADPGDEDGEAPADGSSHAAGAADEEDEDEGERSPGSAQPVADADDEAGGGRAAPPPSPTAARAAALAEPRRPNLGRAGGVWTEPRLALLAELYPSPTPVRAILDRINALPGLPCASVASLMVTAGKRGIKRGPPAGDPGDAPPAMGDDDVAEARGMLASGAGARALADEFGGSLAWWQRWCEAERATTAATAPSGRAA